MRAQEHAPCQNPGNEPMFRTTSATARYLQNEGAKDAAFARYGVKGLSRSSASLMLVSKAKGDVYSARATAYGGAAWVLYTPVAKLWGGRLVYLLFRPGVGTPIAGQNSMPSALFRTFRGLAAGCLCPGG